MADCYKEETGKKNNQSDDKEEVSEITEPEHLRKLFIGGLDIRTTAEMLQEHFEKWGTIVDYVIMKHRSTKRSRGFGFVTYSQSWMVDKAQAARPHKIDGRRVEPQRAVPRKDIKDAYCSSPIRKLYVGGLREEHDEGCLREYFAKFGNIIDIHIATDKDTGRMRGFAFIEYDDYDPVDKIILLKKHVLKNKTVDVKKALPKSNNAAPRFGNNDIGIRNRRDRDRDRDRSVDDDFVRDRSVDDERVAPDNRGNQNAGSNIYSNGNNYNGNIWSSNAICPWQEDCWPNIQAFRGMDIGNGVGGGGVIGATNVNGYQQTYGGGPQYGNNLSGSRMQPYSNFARSSRKTGFGDIGLGNKRNF